MIDINDRLLMDWFYRGFRDELDGIKYELPDIDIIRKAYNIGSSDAIIGDDLPSYDYKRTEKIILKEIWST